MEGENTKNRRVADFVFTEIYLEAKRLIKESKSVLFLHGCCGSGKTEIAKAVGEDYGGYVLIKCGNEETMKNDLIEFCTKMDLDVSFPADCYPLAKFFDFGVSTTRLLILDDVFDIDSLLSALTRKHSSTKIIVTTQENISASRFHTCPRSLACVNPDDCLKMKGFTEEEAKHYLNISGDLLAELLEQIGTLPIALRAFKGVFHSIQLESKEDIVKQFIIDMDKGEPNLALRCISECMKRAIGDNPVFEMLVKHLSMYSRNDIYGEIIYVLTEELGISKPRDVANNFVSCLDKRSLCDISRSDAGIYSITLHHLVKKAMERRVTADEHDNVIRVSLQAFSRVMPIDGRSHQYPTLPKMLKHGTSLIKKLKKSGTIQHALTQLLKGQLLTSIGYCMISHRRDRTEFIEVLEEGLEVFLRLLIHQGSRNLEAVGALLQRDSETEHLQQDPNYLPYIKKLQQFYRITPRDFEHLFKPEKYDKFNEKLSNGHLTKSALDQLSTESFLLLPVGLLAKIYALELFAFHLHMLSRAYAAPAAGCYSLRAKAVQAAEKADAIYRKLKQRDVPLLAMYVNKRDLLNLKLADGDFSTLSLEWEELLKAEGVAFECGIARAKNMKEDKYHLLLCLEGKLRVCGKKAMIPNLRESALVEGDYLIKEIVELSELHLMKHITLSKCYQHIAEFYESFESYHNAISYLIKSMMEYNLYCRDSRKGSQHPELDDDMRKKFDTIFEKLKHCIRESPQPYPETSIEAKRYIRSLVGSWEERCRQTHAGGSETYTILLEL